MYSTDKFGNYNGIWYASTGSNNPWAGSNSNPWTLETNTELGTPCAGGHVTNQDNIEYIDGVVVSHCTSCGTRIVISRLPGGISFLKIRTLLGSLVSLEEGAQIGIEFAELLATYSEIIEELEKELEQIQQAQKLADIAAKMLKKVHHGSDENT